MTIGAENFEFVRTLVHEESGVVLESSKGYLIEARLGPIAREAGAASVDEFITQLRRPGAPPASSLVVEALTTKETQFFRDPHVFDALRTAVLPALIAKRLDARRLNLWSAAAASGQEAYSLAMLLAEHFPELSTWAVNLVASDMSETVIAHAQRGAYRRVEVARGLPEDLLAKYFRRDAVTWQISSTMQRRVDFCIINLIRDWPVLPPMDVVLLRNVLIYFDHDTKTAILAKVRQLLKPDGYLVLGTAETTLTLDRAFKVVQCGGAVCYQVRS